MGKIIVGMPLFLVILNVFFILLFSWTYKALTHETVIANIKFDQQNINDKSFVAHIQEEDGDKIGDFKIYGEQWRIDAKFMKMKYWANILNLDSRYALERFEGRYESVDDENSKEQLSHNLGEDTILDSVELFGWNPFVDAEFGSSTYQDINPEYEYIVYKTQTGIIVRSKIIRDNENTTKGVMRFLKNVNPF